MSHKSNNSQQKKWLKIIRDNDTYRIYFDPALKNDPNYDYGTNAFLLALYLVIKDFGHCMPTTSKDKPTVGGGNSTWGEVTDDNLFLFGDDFDDLTYEMDYDQFVKINNEYYKLCYLMADEIILSRIGNKVSIEGKWHNTGF